MTVQHVAEYMQNIFNEAGLSEQIFSDNGPYYTDKEFHDMCKRLDINHLISCPHHHHSYDLGEKYVKIAKTKLNDKSM